MPINYDVEYPMLQKKYRALLAQRNTLREALEEAKTFLRRWEWVASGEVVVEYCRVQDKIQAAIDAAKEKL